MGRAKRSMMFRLGQFVGGVARGVTAPVDGKTQKDKTQKKVLRHDVQEQTRLEPDGTVTLRRTTIEEVEVRQTPKPPEPPPQSTGESR